jgi:hypothetical protein
LESSWVILYYFSYLNVMSNCSNQQAPWRTLAERAGWIEIDWMLIFSRNKSISKLFSGQKWFHFPAIFNVDKKLRRKTDEPQPVFAQCISSMHIKNQEDGWHITITQSTSKNTK